MFGSLLNTDSQYNQANGIRVLALQRMHACRQVSQLSQEGCARFLLRGTLLAIESGDASMTANHRAELYPGWTNPYLLT